MNQTQLLFAVLTLTASANAFAYGPPDQQTCKTEGPATICRISISPNFNTFRYSVTYKGVLIDDSNSSRLSMGVLANDVSENEIQMLNYFSEAAPVSREGEHNYSTANLNQVGAEHVSLEVYFKNQDAQYDSNYGKNYSFEF